MIGKGLSHKNGANYLNLTASHRETPSCSEPLHQRRFALNVKLIKDWRQYEAAHEKRHKTPDNFLCHGMANRLNT
jgi:hypothetical protein